MTQPDPRRQRRHLQYRRQMRHYLSFVSGARISYALLRRSKITIQWEAGKQWRRARRLAALSSSRPPPANRRVARRGPGGKRRRAVRQPSPPRAPRATPSPTALPARSSERSVDSAISLAKRSYSFGRATFFFCDCTVRELPEVLQNNATQKDDTLRADQARGKSGRGPTPAGQTRKPWKTRVEVSGGGRCVLNVVIAEANS